jgi:voltage-gated potassium channel
MRRNWLDLVFVVLLASPLLRLFSFLRFTRLHPLLRLGMLIRRHKRQVLRLILLSRDSFPVAMAVLFLMVFLFGTAAWMLEHGSNPAFAEVGDGLWWAFVTLTTVGYGDIVPVTEGGRIVAVLTMVFGIAVYSLLIANLTHFLETLEPSRQADAGAEAAVSEPARATSEEA